MDNQSNDIGVKSDKQPCNYVLLIIIFIVVLLVIFWFNSSFNPKYDRDNKDNKNDKLEHMTGGTLTQMFANDSQDVNIKSGINNLASGDFNLYWNQPTRVAYTYPNRGGLLPSTIVPIVSAIENGNTPNSVDIPTYNPNEKIAYQHDLAVLEEENRVKLLENNSKFLQQNCGEKCYTNPQSCGNGEGGYRLGSDWVEPSKAKPFVSLQGNVYYPDQYVGEYWLSPVPDIYKPLPVIANGIPPLPF